MMPFIKARQPRGGVENSILENHMRTCMSREIKAGNMETIKEVMELIKRLR